MPLVNCKLGKNVIVPHDELVNLYGCEIGDNSKVGAFVEIQKNAKIGKNVKVNIPIVADAKLAVKALTAALKKKAYKQKGEWKKGIVEGKKKCDTCVNFSNKKKIFPKEIIDEVNKLMKKEDIVCTGVGQHQMFAMHYLRLSNPRTFISSGGAGTMGFGLPAAIGAKVAKPKSNVFCLDGDGSFQMTIQELETIRSHKIKIVPIIFNNSFLGMVRQWLELFHEKRYSQVHLGNEIDFVKIAKAYHLDGITVEKPSELADAIKQALKADKTTVVDVKIEEESNILPMLPPGGHLKEAFGKCMKEPGKFF